MRDGVDKCINESYQIIKQNLNSALPPLDKEAGAADWKGRLGDGD